MTLLRTDRDEAAEGARVREFARIARETAERSTDPRVMAMARASRSEGGRTDRYATIARRQD